MSFTKLSPALPMTLRSIASPAALVAAVAAAVTVLHAQNPAITVTVDVGANRRAINPAVYGVAYATVSQLQDLNAPLHRYGGNNTSRYNWQLNADNRGADWYFESIAESSATPGQRGDDFVLDSRAANAEPMVTIPIIEYVAKLGSSRSKLASFDSRVYGAQDDCDWQWFPQACNGMKAGQPVTGNNPLDANVVNGTTLQAGWVSHLVQRFGSAAAGGLKYYILDNEHSIWHSTHRDVRPTGATMEQVRDAMIAYSGAIKNIDPGALVVGPEEWGWSGYIFSGYDQQYGSQHGWSFLPDRAAHGGMDYLPWLLQQLKTRSDIDQRRVIDVFTAHYYPQGGEFWPPDNVSSAMQLRRNRSTRSLWDPAYTDETWINDRVQLIPRLRNWANTVLLRGHADRDHRVQLGRRESHQRRHHAGGHLRHLRPRRTRPRRAMDDSRDDNAHLQGDEDVPQLRREPIGLRRHERARDVDSECRQSVGVRRPAVWRLGPDGDGDLESVVGVDARDDQPRELRAGNCGPGVAAHGGEHHYAPRGCDRVRPGIRGDRTGAEHHAVRRRAIGRTGEPAAGRPRDRDANIGERTSRRGLRRQHLVRPGRIDCELRVVVR